MGGVHRFFSSLLSTAAFVPQAYKIYKEKQPRGFANHVFGHVVWGVVLEVYGLMIGKWPVILANLISASIFALYHLR